MGQKAIIVDIDGTLSNNDHRMHMFNVQNKDWAKINEASIFDLPVLWCQDMVHIYNDAGYKILFVTGRNITAENVTREWLMRYLSPMVDYVLYMRPENDRREDCDVKLDIYNNKIAPMYDVAFCLEDRDSVTAMWRHMAGLICLQVKDSTY